jgi:crotonobetainyl-CoA:carnitine CoA-transferase CaiB-like acyl-CoA transferase
MEKTLRKEPLMDTQYSATSDMSVFGRSSDGPLSGILIADFGRVLAGPYCTMLLADLGATVIKIESLGGDETRAWRPPTYGDDSTYFLSINRNKTSIKLDLRDSDDRRTAQRIAERADVVVENFKPGDLVRYGLDYDTVSVTNKDVVYASITGFGTAGGAQLPGYDLLIQALSGLMDLTGAPDTEPFRSGIAVFDVITGLHTCIGILAALRHRDRIGEGQLVEMNLMSSALSGMVNQTTAVVLDAAVPVRLGNEHPSIYPYEPFDTGDGKLVIAIGNDSQYRTFCAAIGKPELAEDPRFEKAPVRSANRQELRPLLMECLSTRPASEWFDILTEAKLPCAPIQDLRAGIEFAERIGLEPVVTVGRGESALLGVRNPIRLSKTPVTYDLAPPALDSGAQLVRAWLGADQDPLADAIAGPPTRSPEKR